MAGVESVNHTVCSRRGTSELLCVGVQETLKLDIHKLCHGSHLDKRLKCISEKHLDVSCFATKNDKK